MSRMCWTITSKMDHNGSIPSMYTKMNEADWEIALEAFRACRPRRGAKAKNDRLFLEALHYFSVHNNSWRAPPERF